MRAIKTGDIVVGNEGNGYGITGRGSVCKVTYVYNYQEIRVKVIEPSGHYINALSVLAKAKQIGKEFDVDSRYFSLKNQPLLTENE